VREVFPHASERRVCRLLSVPRSAMSGRRSATQKEPTTDRLLTTRIEELIGKHPTFGYRRLWAILGYRDGLLVNRKTVYRILKVKGWFCHERRHTPWPRVRGLRKKPASPASRLPSPPGVHHPLHPRAERHDRTLLPELEGGVRLAASVSGFRGGQADNPGLDPPVQRGAAPSEPQLPESGRVPGPTTTTGGLKSGEEYRMAIGGSSIMPHMDSLDA